MDGSAFHTPIPQDREIVLAGALVIGTLVAIGVVIGWFLRGLFL